MILKYFPLPIWNFKEITVLLKAVSRAEIPNNQELQIMLQNVYFNIIQVQEPNFGFHVTRKCLPRAPGSYSYGFGTTITFCSNKVCALWSKFPKITPLLWHKLIHLVEIKGCSFASFSSDFFFFKIEKQLILLNECSVAMTSLQTNTKPSSTFSLGVDLVFKHVFDHLDSLSFPILWISSNIPQSDRYIGLELLTTSEGYSCIHSSPHSRPLPAVPTNSLWLQHQASATCNSRQQICPKESLSLWD